MLCPLFPFCAGGVVGVGWLPWAGGTVGVGWPPVWSLAGGWVGAVGWAAGVTWALARRMKVLMMYPVVLP